METEIFNSFIHNPSVSVADLISVPSTIACGHLINRTLESSNKTQCLPAEIIRLEVEKKNLVFGNADEMTSLKWTASANERREEHRTLKNQPSLN